MAPTLSRAGRRRGWTRWCGTRAWLPGSTPITIEKSVLIMILADRAEVWQRVRAALADLLRAHGAVDVKLCLAAEPPHANPRSGKLRHVLQSPPSAASYDP